MARGFFGSMCALATLVSLTVGTAGAQEVVTGTVKQVDERAGVIVFEDGRQVRTTGRTIVLLERPVDRLGAVTPGTTIVVINPDAANASPAFTPDTTLPSPYAPNDAPQAP
jgi:hypothetical protein